MLLFDFTPVPISVAGVTSDASETAAETEMKSRWGKEKGKCLRAHAPSKACKRTAALESKARELARRRRAEAED